MEIDADIALEMDYTPYEASCLYSNIADGEILGCRRQRGHDGDHAVRSGVAVLRWENPTAR